MKRSTILLVIALAAGPGSVSAFADDPKKAPAADAQPKDAAKDVPKEAKDEPKPGNGAANDAPKDTSGASAEVKVGTGVENREIVGEAASFPAGTTVWVWSLVLNGEGNVKHVWKRDGKEVWTATLRLGSKRWSTYSRRAIPAAGSWEVDVQTEAGASLGTVAFTIQ